MSGGTLFGNLVDGSGEAFRAWKYRRDERFGPGEASQASLPVSLGHTFIFVTVAAITFALFGRFGVDGFMERLGVAITIGGVFVPLEEFYYWWKREIEDG